MSYPLDTIIKMARAVQNRPAYAGVLSTGEKCAMGLLHNNADYLPAGYTFLDAVDRLEGEWLAAVLKANRQGWRE